MYATHCDLASSVNQEITLFHRKKGKMYYSFLLQIVKSTFHSQNANLILQVQVDIW